MKIKKCTGCKKDLKLKDFKIKSSGEYTKQCLFCLERSKTSRIKKYCDHGRQKSRCQECNNCESFNKGKCSRCKKPYEPNDSVLYNGKPLQTCEKCRHESSCPHGIRSKKKCKDCQKIVNEKYRLYCEHNNRSDNCKLCSGCEHNKLKNACNICSPCPHEERKYTCIECVGCEHGKRQNCCKICDPNGHLVHTVRNTVYKALKSNKSERSMEYLDCNVKTLRKHIEEQFEEGMTWENHGEWHIDHITPIKYRENGEEPSLEEIIERLHYTNLQPLWAGSNMSKGNRYVG